MTFNDQLFGFPSEPKVKHAKISMLGCGTTDPEFLLVAGHCRKQHVWGCQQMFGVPLHTEHITVR